MYVVIINQNLLIVYNTVKSVLALLILCAHSQSAHTCSITESVLLRQDIHET